MCVCVCVCVCVYVFSEAHCMLDYTEGFSIDSNKYMNS